MNKPSIEKPWMKYYKDFNGDISSSKCTLYSYLKKAVKDHHSYIALEYYGKKFTYGDLLNQADRLAECYTNLGVKKGDKVVFVTANVPTTIFSFYALNKIGAIPTLVEPRMAKERIEHFIEMVHADVVVLLDIVYPKVYDLFEKHNIKHVLVQVPRDNLVWYKKLAAKLKAPKSRIPYGDTIIRFKKFASMYYKPGMAKEVEFEEGSLCAITQTGGTTGVPKGVMLTNEGLNAIALAFTYSHNHCVPGDIFLNIMPIFTSYGVVCGVHMALTYKVHAVLVPDFTPNKFPGLVKKYKPHCVIGVPTFYESLIKSPLTKHVNLKNLKFAVSGGDVLNPTLEFEINDFFEKHGCKYQIVQGYGLSETSAVTSFNCIYREHSEGLPLCTSTMGIFDQNTGEELDYYQKGEICITGPSIMKGYYDNDEETSNVIRKHADGTIWVHSGDLGYFDKDGFLFFEGRIKFVIPRFDGHKNFPIQIERVVVKHTDVANCAVVPCNDREHIQGMYPLIIAELNQGVTDKARVKKEIMKLCKENIEERGQPCDCIIVSKIPLTLIGKNDVKKLTDMYINYDYTRNNELKKSTKKPTKKTTVA